MRVFLISLLFITTINAFSQGQQIKDRRNSVGLALGFIPKHHEEIFIPAIDFDYSYAITDVWSVGVFSGIHFTKTPFYTLGAGLDANIFRNFSLGLFSGATILDNKWSGLFGADLSLEFSFGRFNFGPVFEISYHNKHEHVMIGIHSSYSF